MAAGTSASVRGARPGWPAYFQTSAVSPSGRLERGPRVGDHRVDLRPVPDDARVGHQPGHVLLAEGRHGLGVEPGEGGAEVLPLAQDGQPGQPGLEALQAKPLEDRRVAAYRTAPLLVVIGEILRGAQPPGAAQLPVRTLGRAPLRRLLGHQPCSSAAARESPFLTRPAPCRCLASGRFLASGRCLASGRFLALGGWARLLFAGGYLLLGPPAVRVEGALRALRFVRRQGSRRAGSPRGLLRDAGEPGRAGSGRRVRVPRGAWAPRP